MAIGTIRISKLINDLSHPDASRKRSAAEALSSGDERAIYPLIKALKDENTGVQEAVMRSLISIGGEVVAYMVLPILRDEPYMRNTATLILKEIGQVAIPLLRPLLKDKDEDVRKFAIDIICEVKQCDYPQELVRSLSSDPSPNVRASAAKAIGILQYKEALPQLLDAFKDEDWVCFSALESLAMIKDKSSIEPIVSLLNSPSETIRFAAIDTLGKIGSSSSINPLLDHMQITDGFEKAATIKSLIQVGITPSTPGVSDVLIDMFRNGEWDEKLIALKGLCDLKEEKALYSIIDTAGSLDPSEPDADEKLLIMKDALKNFGCNDVLIEILNEPEIRYRGRQIVIELLGNLRCNKATPHIVKLLENKSRDVRRAAATALGEIKNEDAEESLIISMDDYDGHVRKAAICALGMIGDKAAIQPLLRLLHVEVYKDLIDEAVKAILNIDSAALFLHPGELTGDIKEAISKYSNDVDILLSLSKDEDPMIRMGAISGLGKIQGEKASKRVAEALRDNNSVIRKAAVMAMGEMDCCNNEIKSALNDEDMWVRLYAVKALGHSLKQDMIKTLTPMLSDKDVPVVLSTIDAIIQQGGRDAISILTPLLNHGESVIREKVQQAIEGFQK